MKYCEEHLILLLLNIVEYLLYIMELIHNVDFIMYGPTRKTMKAEEGGRSPYIYLDQHWQNQ